MPRRMILKPQVAHHYLELEINARICSYPIVCIPMPYNPADNWRVRADLGQVGNALMTKLSTIDGITQVFIRPYSMEIHAARVFDWIDIEEAIVNVMREEFGEDDDLEVIGQTKRNVDGVIPFNKP